MPAGSLFQDQRAMTKDEQRTPPESPDASTDEKRRQMTRLQQTTYNC